jgi:pantoate--beta-alanine ligase
MEIIRTISWMKESVRKAHADNHIVGFIPTMGALHAGHLSLIRRARMVCSRVFTSIFLNPTQFGPNEDLTKYPRTFETDVEKLTSAGVDVLFAPEAKEIYPPEFRTYVNVEGLSDKLEGKSRPGHFRGVSTVVLKLFEIVQPQFAFFGRKDAQQVRILQQMTGDLNLNVEIVVCPIVREPDGLALSSRNVYLNSEERRAATILHRALDGARQEMNAGMRDALQLQTSIQKILAGQPLARVDYVAIVDVETFEPVSRIDAKPTYVLIAVYVGKTRLIDNLFIERVPGRDTLLCSL